MKKRKQAYNNPEYKQIKDHLPEILEEMEKDKDLKEFQIPEEWDNDFERIYQKQRRKERIRTRILTGACCAVILGIGIVHIGEHMEGFTIVHADDIDKTKESGFTDEDYEYSISGNVEEENNNLMIDDSDEITFEESDLQTLYQNLKKETRAPIFWFTNLSDDSKVSCCMYNRVHRTISYRITVNDRYVHVSQKKQIEETADGAVKDKESVQEIEISSLSTKVMIYKSTQDDSYYCNLVYDNNVISIISNMDLEDYIKMIEGLDYH